jgi:molecular chaperone GrpE (heat shock protein)
MVRNWKQEKILRVTAQDDNWSKEKEMLDFARRQNEEKNSKKRQEIGRQVRAYREQKKVRRMREDEERARAEEDRERNKVRLTQEDRRRLKGKELASFMHKMNPILEKIHRKEAAKQKKENLQQQYRSKFATLPSKFLEGTESHGLKVRAKFSPSREKGKFADYLAGNVIRTTGRAMVGWRADIL